MAGENIDYFNEMVGLIFDHLYREFPVRTIIDAETIAKAMKVGVSHPKPGPLTIEMDTSPRFEPLPNGADFLTVLKHCRWWLQEEDFIRGGDENGVGMVQLTTKAFLAMNAQPAALDRSLGSKLGDAVKSAGTETGRAVICETVGQILGAAAKGFTL